jgi:hypothetical protein
MAQQPETLFRLRVVEPGLKTIPDCHFEKVQAGSMRGRADMNVCIRGRMVRLELKTDDGHIEPLQRWNLEQWKKAGAYTAIVQPSNWHQVLAELRKL